MLQLSFSKPPTDVSSVGMDAMLETESWTPFLHDIRLQSSSQEIEAGSGRLVNGYIGPLREGVTRKKVTCHNFHKDICKEARQKEMRSGCSGRAQESAKRCSGQQTLGPALIFFL